MLRHKVADTAGGELEGPVCRLPDGLVKHQDQGGQNGDAADHAQQNAFGHDNAHIQPQRKAHKAQGDKTGDGGQGGAGHRSDSGRNGVGHSLLVIWELLPLLLVAAPKEDGVVHGHAQLKHCHQGHGDKGNLSFDKVGAQVVNNGHADAEHKEHRDHEGVHGNGQHQATEQHRDHHIGGHLLLHQVFGVRDDGGHTGQEAVLPGEGANGPDGVHGLIGGGGRVEEDRHQRGIPVF